MLVRISLNCDNLAYNEGAPNRGPLKIPTPGLHNKIPALKIFARGWVAQESICTLSTLRFSRGWVRKDGNLVMEAGCRVDPTTRLSYGQVS